MLSEIRVELSKHYGKRLEGVVLFGSTARGDDREDSDVDLLVLLAPPLDYGLELAEIIRVLFPVSLKFGREISPKPALTRDYEEAEFPLYRSAKQDGVLL